MFTKCPSSNSPPHGGNTRPQIAKHFRGKKAIGAQIRHDAHVVSNEEHQLDFDEQENKSEELVIP